MPKYYVKSGQIKYILDRKNEELAIIDTIKHYYGQGYLTGPKICVSEKGFDDFKNWTCYDTDEYMRKAKDKK